MADGAEVKESEATDNVTEKKPRKTRSDAGVSRGSRPRFGQPARSSAGVIAAIREASTASFLEKATPAELKEMREQLDALKAAIASEAKAREADIKALLDE